MEGDGGCDREPERCLRRTGGGVAGEGRDELGVVGNRVRELLDAIVAATDTDADASAEAEWLVNELGEHGLGDYRDALSPDDPPTAGRSSPPE